MSYASVLVAVAVVDCLHATAARSVVLRSGYLHLAVVWERTDRLDKSLSVASCAHDDASVMVLDASGNDFRCRCRA